MIVQDREKRMASKHKATSKAAEAREAAAAAEAARLRALREQLAFYAQL